MESKPKARILVVDEQADTRLATSALLEGAGYEVLAASTPEEVQAACAGESFAVAVLDPGLSGGAGRALLQQLQVPPLSLVPALCFSSTAPGDLAGELSERLDAFLPKSAPPALLAAQVGALLRLRAEREAAATAVEQAQAAQHDLQQVLEALPLPVAIAHDVACRRVTVNPAGAEVFGVSADTNVSYVAPEGVQPCRFFQAGVELTPESMPLQRAMRRGSRGVGHGTRGGSQ